MGFAGVYSSLASSYVAQGKLVHYPVHRCIYQGDKNMPFEGYYSRLGLLLESCSWQEDVGQIWTDLFHIWKSGYGVIAYFELGAATNVLERTVVNK